MAIEDFFLNEDWEYVVPITAYFEIMWVPKAIRNELENDTQLHRYVIHRLRRTRLNENIKYLVEKFVNDYYDELDEKNTWNE